MIHKKQTFAVLDGWLCLRRETTFSDEPKKAIHYWPFAPWQSFNGSYDAIVVQPFLVQTDQTGSNGPCVRSIDQPLPTIVTKQNIALVQPFLTKYFKRRSIRSRLAVLGVPFSTFDDPFDVDV